jgi:membrane protease YdiL (CAAX protease family)
MNKCVKKGVLTVLLSLIFALMFTTVYAATQPVCGCKALTYRFSLKNNEAFSETYALSADKFSDSVSFDQDKIVLASGEIGPILVFVDLPCDLTGEHTVNIIVKGEKSGEKKIPIKLNLVSCYNYDVELGKDFLITGEKRKLAFEGYEGNYFVCKGDKKAIPLLVTNKGVDNDYSLGIGGAGWAKLSGSSLKLAKNQRGVVYLSLLPPEELIGTFELEFNIVNSLGNIEKSIPIEVDIERCYGINISLPRDEDVLCGCEPKRYDVFVENIGKYNDSFDFVTEPFWASLELDESIGLGASDGAFVNLSVEPPCNELKATEVKITGFLRSHPEIKQSASLKLDFLSEDKCYGAVISADKQVEIDYDATSIPFTIKNEGGKEITYSISLDAPSWVSSEIERVSLKPGDAVELNLFIWLNGSVAENDYAVKINLDSEDYTQSKIIVLNLKEETELNNVKRFVEDYWYYFLAVVLLVGIFIIVFSGRKKKKELGRQKKPKKWIPYAILIFILLAVIAVIIYLLYRFSLFSKIGWFLFWYQYYIYTLLLLLVILILIILFFVKRGKKKKKIKTEVKKAVKGKVKRVFGSIYIFLILIIIIGIIAYSLNEYNLFVKEFILTYLYYIIFGIALLIILILIIRFNKWMTDLFLGEKKNKKR